MTPIDFNTLPPEEQARIRAQLTEPVDPKKAARSAAAKQRKKTGDDFEAELDVQHSYYEHMKYGKIRRNYVPTKVVGAPKRGVSQRVVLGPAHVDRTGWVSVAKGTDDTGRFFVPVPWHAPTSQRITVAFDAKVLGERTKRGWYFHDVELQHQLHDLKAAAEAGEYAFLLVLDRAANRVFGIQIQEHLTALLSGRGVQLYDTAPATGIRALQPLHFFLPSIEKRGQEVGWDWIPLLSHCAPR